MPAGKIGIMGGTFDPIHLGHLMLAEAARTELSLDGILFLPTGCSYLKAGRNIADREDRYRMTALSVADNPAFFVSRMEIDRPGNTYTADTLELLTEAYPRNTWYYLMGADSYMMLDRWVRPEDICRLATLVCTVRGDTEREILRGQEKLLKERFDAETVFLKQGRMDISSSEIRARIARGESVKYFVRDEVIRYIDEHGLYR